MAWELWSFLCLIVFKYLINKNLMRKVEIFIKSFELTIKVFSIFRKKFKYKSINYKFSLIYYIQWKKKNKKVTKSIKWRKRIAGKYYCYLFYYHHSLFIIHFNYINIYSVLERFHRSSSTGSNLNQIILIKINTKLSVRS